MRRPGLVVVEDEVAMGERAALGVLAGQPDGGALEQQAREGERLGLTPVDPALLAERLSASFELAGELRVDLEPVGHGEELLVELAERRLLDRGPRHAEVPALRCASLLTRGRELLLQLLVRLLQARLDAAQQLLVVPLGDDTLARERLRVELSHRRVALDRLHHQRLCVGRLVLLVVAEAPVADEVDDDVVAEARPEGHGEPDRGDGRLRVVGVDVEDGRVEALGEVARIPRRAPLGRVGREADLVVRDDVERAARRIAGDGLEVERLCDDALSREGRVTVDENGDGRRRVVLAGGARLIGLGGPRLTLDHRVDRLEMARVRREHDRQGPGVRLRSRRCAEVVLDVPAALLALRGNRGDRALALELAQDLLGGSAEHVGQHAEPATVRHAEHGALGAGCARPARASRRAWG